MWRSVIDKIRGSFTSYCDSKKHWIQPVEVRVQNNIVDININHPVDKNENNALFIETLNIGEVEYNIRLFKYSEDNNVYIKLSHEEEDGTFIEKELKLNDLFEMLKKGS